MRRFLAVTVVGCVFAATTRTSAQEPFYTDKPIRIIVGLAAGGGFDTYARVIARHLAKHIPGKPTVVVENMTGAGSIIAANHVYNVAKPDGLTVGHFVGSFFLTQILGQEGLVSTRVSSNTSALHRRITWPALFPEKKA
jgi:tripartite-type tricarboxylate transporter receptor subunit TctC